jgi:hypothetical protein
VSDVAATTALVPLERLRANENFQPRYDGLDQRHLRLLMQSDPATWPPLLVTPNEIGGYDLIDGFHRFEAARRLRVVALPCRIDPQADYPDGVLANLTHGLPLKLEDRKIAAQNMHSLEPQLSYREIGRRTGLHHETVKRVLESRRLARQGQQRAKPDPIERLVDQVVRISDASHGRSWFGLGHDGNAKPLRRAIETYQEEERLAVARALVAFGHACVAAAEPFLAQRS